MGGWLGVLEAPAGAAARAACARNPDRWREIQVRVSSWLLGKLFVPVLVASPSSCLTDGAHRIQQLHRNPLPP